MWEIMDCLFFAVFPWGSNFAFPKKLWAISIWSSPPQAMGSFLKSLLSIWFTVSIRIPIIAILRENVKARVLKSILNKDGWGHGYTLPFNCFICLFVVCLFVWGAKLSSFFELLQIILFIKHLLPRVVCFVKIMGFSPHPPRLGQTHTNLLFLLPQCSYYHFYQAPRLHQAPPSVFEGAGVECWEAYTHPGVAEVGRREAASRASSTEDGSTTASTLLAPNSTSAPLTPEPKVWQNFHRHIISSQL